VACSLDLVAMREELLHQRTEMVFNLVESLAGADSLVYLPPAVLDVMGLPYCGSRTEGLFLTTHKLLAKERMQQAGLPTPPWIEHKSHHHKSHTSHTSHSPSSWILKGVWDQASRGMGDDAVLRSPDQTELLQRLAQRAERSPGPCFAEQFIEGREFNLSVLGGPNGPEALPPAEIDFSAFPPGKPRIVGHRAKWLEDSFEYQNTPRRFDFDPADRPLLDRLCDLARQCWRLFRLRGWVRVDFRVDAAGQPWILEINSNPCLSHDAGFAAALQQASIPFDAAIQRILEDTED
jgi:D-alanine-D-alanine ligase